MYVKILVSAVSLSPAMAMAQDQITQLPLDASSCSIARALGQTAVEFCAPQRTKPSALHATENARPLVVDLRRHLGKLDAIDQASTATTFGLKKPAPVAKMQLIPVQNQIDPDIPQLPGGGYYVQFSFGSFDLDPKFENHLVTLAKVLSAPSMSDLCIRVTGHTDNIGSADYNQQLAQNRALMVASRLAELGNISPDRIQICAAGEAEPLAAVAGDDPLNRRVEFSAKDLGGACKAI